MQTNASCEVPVGMHRTIQTILDLNPEYDYHYFDNESSRNFLVTEYGSRLVAAYDDLIPGAFKADLFRYCYLYKHGGIYIDTGMTCLKPFREMIREDDRFVAPEDNGNGISIYNAFIACTPKHPIIARAILLSFKNIEKRDKTDEMLNMTGPGILGIAFKHVIRRNTTLIPNTYYGYGMRLIRHIGGNKLHKDPHDIVGEVDQNGVVFLKTKYPEYYEDRQWYHKTEHYGVLWNQDQVFKSVVEHRFKPVECPSEKISPSDERILQQAIRHRTPHREGQCQKIPKIIIQTSESEMVPRGMYHAMKTVADHNDDYEYFYFDARSRREFIEDNFEVNVLYAYDKLVPGAFKADLFRYCFLYIRGGVYIDSGMVSIRPLRTLIDSDDELIVPEDDGRERMCNGFICSVPGHIVFEQAIERIVANVECEYYGSSALDVTGPNLMGSIFDRTYGKKVKDGMPIYPGVKIIRYTSSLSLTGSNCAATGTIFHGPYAIFDTKYDDYYRDRQWYLKTEQYDTYWQLRQLYR